MTRDYENLSGAVLDTITTPRAANILRRYRAAHSRTARANYGWLLMLNYASPETWRAYYQELARANA